MKLQILLFGLVMFLSCAQANAQRVYSIESTVSVPIVDGILTDSVWQFAEVATDFIVQNPVFGGKSRFDTRIRMVYDNNALYIGGELHYPFPDSASFNLSPRDNEGNADWFGISIDTYGNNVSAFDFMLTSAGVELDGIEDVYNLDFSWNAVWRSATAKTEYGWSFEMKIPYSALRFPNKSVQNWNINFWRSVRLVREISTWNPIDPQVFGEITQSGRLVGIENIKSPLRLSFTPYATGYLENSYDEELGKQTWKQRATGGLDLKYGLNDAFTLDMSLIPDFGQTTSDRQVLNLGPFEVRFDENRPFFLEGTDLFGIGEVFYSRRIASTPFNFYSAYDNLDESKGERVVANPSLAPMINGTKVSGRTSKGLGIGVFNAVEGQTFAIIADSLDNERRVKTNPYTNYNVFVLSQNLKNNSTVSVVNTHVFREGENRDANVTVGSADLYSKGGDYNLYSQVNVSSIFENDAYQNGHAAYVGFGKVGGEWQYGFNYGEESDLYDPNDLGFLYNNNSRSYSADLSWNYFKPGKYFFRKSASVQVYYEELYKPQLFSNLYMSARIGGLHKKQIYSFIELESNPIGMVDHFESRNFGKEVLFKPNVRVNYLISTDYSKRFAVDAYLWYQKFFGVVQNGAGLSLSPRVRVSDRMNIIVDVSVDFLQNDYGYVRTLDEAYADQILLGVRDRVIVENTLRAEFIFTKRMGVDIRVRHYWQEVNYDHFEQLFDEGKMERSDYFPALEDGSSEHNTSYNAFTIDVNYNWVFLPGSQLIIVYKNNIFHSKNDLDKNYFRTYGSFFDEPQINSISLKALFFIDALYFRKKKNRS